MQRRTEAADITSCDNEPVRFIGGVQAHGLLIGFTPDWRIHLCSENAKRFFDDRDLVGHRLTRVLSPSAFRRIEELLATSAWKKRNLQRLEFPVGELGSTAYEGSLFESEGLLILELEAQPPSMAGGDFELQESLNQFLTRLRSTENLAQAASVLCAAVREITGLDRVMMYRFIPPTWHGQVLAENKIASAASFLEHRFPASDIPRPARELYLRNHVRLIPNVDSEVSPIQPLLNPVSGKILDLGDSRIRAVSPLHLEYLRNMGVKGSFSVAVVIRDRLWGLIACHHLAPIWISHRVRSVCEVLAGVFASRAELVEALDEQRRRLAFEDRLAQFVSVLRTSPDPLGDLLRRHRELEDCFSADGVAFISLAGVDMAGLTPTVGELRELSLFLRQRMAETNRATLATENLSSLDPRWKGIAESASGILAVTVPEIDDGLLIFFRGESVRTITWGGDPRKNLEKRDYQGRLNPRLSFESWTETIHGTATEWSPWEITGATRFRDLVFDAFLRKERLIRELNERLHTQKD